MYVLKKIGKLFTSKFVVTGPSSYKKRIYRAAVSQRLRNTGVYKSLGISSATDELSISRKKCTLWSKVHRLFLLI